MLRDIVGYSIGSGIDVRWLVIGGDQRFFDITKRLHNRLHGTLGDGGALGRSEADHYKSLLQENADSLLHRIGAGDVVMLHDPQTLGLAAPLAERGALVVWRCHIGTERTNGHTEEGWRFLEPFLAPCRAYVFSHRGFVPKVLETSEIHIIAPSIDPYSAKNRPLNEARVQRLLVKVGLFGDDGDGSFAEFGARRSGSGAVGRSPRCAGLALGSPQGHAGCAPRASPRWWRGRRVCGLHSSDRR